MSRLNLEDGGDALLRKVSNRLQDYTGDNPQEHNRNHHHKSLKSQKLYVCFNKDGGDTSLYHLLSRLLLRLSSSREMCQVDHYCQRPATFNLKVRVPEKEKFENHCFRAYANREASLNKPIEDDIYLSLS